MSTFDPITLRAALDLVITGLIEVRDSLLTAEQAAAAERRLMQQAEIAALFDLEAADADAEAYPERVV